MTPEDRRTLLESLASATRALGIGLTSAQTDACARYADLLLETNRHTNLTRIVEPAAMAIKHFADSLTVLVACPDIPINATVADVGTGAGFPGLVLKIARPDLRVTLIDSLGKRLRFLAEVVAALDLADVTLVHARAEEAGRDPICRDCFDLVTARAVAALPTLLEWCGPLVKLGGRFVALKAANVDAELPGGTTAATALGLRLAADRALTLSPVPGDDGPDAAVRRLLVYQKLTPTPARYPRQPAEIKAKPLG